MWGRLTYLVLQAGTGGEVGWACEAAEGWTVAGPAALGAQEAQAALGSGGAGWVTVGDSEDEEAWTEVASEAPRGVDPPWAAEAAEGWARLARWT